MNSITLYPRKFSYRDFDDGSFQNLTFEYIDRQLWSFVEVNESVTVRTLIDIMRHPNIEFWQHALTEPFLPDLLDYCDTNLKEKKKSSFDALVFNWRTEFWEWKEDKKNKNEEISIELQASGFVENDPDNPEGYYGLSFTPMEELIDVPIRIDKSFDLNIMGDKHDGLKKISYGNKVPTLIELLKAFVYEVTFMGSEDDKKQKGEEMSQRLDDIKSGRVETKSFNSIDEMKEYFKNIIKDDDECDDDDFLDGLE